MLNYCKQCKSTMKIASLYTKHKKLPQLLELQELNNNLATSSALN
jgi:hypothetical protein